MHNWCTDYLTGSGPTCIVLEVMAYVFSHAAMTEVLSFKGYQTMYFMA